MLCAGPRVGPALVVPARLLHPLGSSLSPSPPAPLLPPAPGKEKPPLRVGREALGASGRGPRPPHLSLGALPDQVLTPASTGSERLEPEGVCVSVGTGGGPFSGLGRGPRRSWVGRRPACVSVAGCGGGMERLGDTAGREFRVASSRLRRRGPLGCRRLRPEWTGSLPPGGFALKGGASSRAERGAWTLSEWLGQSLASPAYLFETVHGF